MSRNVSSSTVGSDARVSLFVFSSLLVFSAVFFIFSGSASGTSNIFQDTDQDGLSNDEEKLYGTDPNNRDSDNDGYGDGVEVESGYDPLKKAPGDKITQEESTTATISPAATNDTATLTDRVSSEIAAALKSSESAEEPLTMEQLSSSVQEILSENTQEITLPDIDASTIKIKKVSKKLSEKKREEQEREDILEYLTVMSYLVANNSPKAFHEESELEDLASSISSESLTALTTGNLSYINQLAEKGEKILNETRDIEVPETMLDTHVKALRIATYAVNLKDSSASVQNDPLGQIALLSKTQGLIGAASSLGEEIQGRLSGYGIKNIPISL